MGGRIHGLLYTTPTGLWKTTRRGAGLLRLEAEAGANESFQCQFDATLFAGNYFEQYPPPPTHGILRT